jgi:hypothetical protein
LPTGGASGITGDQAKTRSEPWRPKTTSWRSASVTS